MPDADRLTPPKLSSLACDAEFWSLRVVEERAASYRRAQERRATAVRSLVDRGAMLTVYADGGCGYAATSDLSRSGLQEALDRARRVGARERAALADRYPDAGQPRAAGRIRLARRRRGGLVAPRLVRPARRRIGAGCGCDPRIVDWEASVETRTAEHRS